MKLKVSLKKLHRLIIQEFNSYKGTNRDTYGIIYSAGIVLFFFVSGILGILEYFIIKVLLFVALSYLFVYCILVMDENKNHLD